MSGIYVASRASYPERPLMWKRLRDDGWPIVSSWIDEAGKGQTQDFSALWERIRSEVSNARALIAFIHPGDLPVRGVFVEIGMALAHSVPVYVVAPHFPPASIPVHIGSWIHHPLVVVCQSLADALIEASHAVSLPKKEELR